MKVPRFHLRTLVLVTLTLGLLGYLNFIPEPMPDFWGEKTKLYCGFPTKWAADEKHFFSSQPEPDPNSNGFVNAWRTPPIENVIKDIVFALLSIFAVGYGSERALIRSKSVGVKS